METVKINIVPKGAKGICYASQYDDGRIVRFNLFSELLPYKLDGSETIKVKVVRPDNVEIIEAVTNTEDYYIDVNISSDMTALAGVASCELEIKKGDMVIGSRNFELNIERDSYGEDITVETVSGAIATFTTNVVDLLQEVKCEINATGGNGTPDNPNPINGYTEANITRCGVNLFDKTTTVNDCYISDRNGQEVDNSGSMCTDFIPVKENTNYYIKTDATSGNWGAWYDSEKNFISGVTGKGVKTSPANACFLRFTIIAISPSIGNPDTFGINYPATDITYHPYTGNTYTIAFGQTVYGGVLDVTRGKLRVDRSITLVTETSLLNKDTDHNGYHRFFFRKDDVVKQTDYVGHIIASACPVVNNYTYFGGFDGEMAVTAYSVASRPENYLYIISKSLSTVAEVQAQFAEEPLQIVYELATPFDIDLTPEVISAVVGTNNVWSDTNGETEVKFFVKEA